MASDTRVLVYDRGGKQIADLTGAMTQRSWVLNAAGKAVFIVPRNDANLTNGVLQFGNFIQILNDRTGPWGGFIWPNRGHRFDGVQIWCKSGEGMLSRRMIKKVYNMTGSPGDAFAFLINLCNEDEDTRIRLGSIFSGDVAKQYKFKHGLIGDVVYSMTVGNRQDFGLDPEIAEDRLIFRANWYRQRGKDWNASLIEGKNVELMAGSPAMLEQGDIVNRSLAIGMGATAETTPTAITQDNDSIALYGLSEGRVQAKAANQSGLDKIAAADVGKRKHPRRVWRVSAIDEDSTFDYLGLGDTLLLRMPSYGLTAAGVGSDVRVRVRAKDYTDAKGVMVLTLDEVIP